MPKKTAPVAPTDSASAGTPLTAKVIQTIREEEHASIALDLPHAALPEAGILPGSRLLVAVPGGEYEVHYHGSMKAWGMIRQFRGQTAVDALKDNPGIEAYLETDRIMAGRRIPGHKEWLRLRASFDGPKLNSPLFSTPDGSTASVRLVNPGVFPTRLPAPKVKNGELTAQVLASHDRAITLSVSAPAVRKLNGPDECWYELQVGDIRVPIRPRRGISPPVDQEVWNTPNALLFDYEDHWANERLTVMLLRPMQWNWKGKFPNFADVLVPNAPVGSTVTIRLAPGVAQ